MNIRQYFQNVSLLFIVNFAIKPIWVFAVERKFQLELGQEVYGDYFAYLSWIYIISIVLDLGLHNYTVKFISENKENYTQFLSELWISKGVLCLAYIGLVALSIIVMGLNQKNGLSFFLIGIEMLCFSIYQYLRCFNQGLQQLKLDSLFSSLDRILLIILGIGLLYLFMPFHKLNLDQFILFHIVAYSLSIAILGFYLKKKISFRIDSFSSPQLTQIIRGGYMLILITLCMSIYSRIDAVLLKYILPSGEGYIGSLAYSNRIVDSAYNTLALLSVFLLPSIAFHYSQRNFRYIQQVVWISFGISTFMSISFILASTLFASKIYLKLYPASTSVDLEVFKLHVWTALGVGWMYVFGSFLTAIGKFKVLFLIVLLGSILSLGLNLYLIPSHKTYGAVMAATIVQMTMGLLHMMAAIYYLYHLSRK